VTVTAPPRAPRPGDPVDREELEALIEALIEEARRRAQRRRRIYGAVAAAAALVSIAVVLVLDRSARSQSASPERSALSSVAAATGNPKLAFIGAAPPGPHFELRVVNADGSGRKRLATTGYSKPAWSPDGQRIAFGVGAPSLHVVNADGTAEQNLTPDAGSEVAPAWSPNGRTIAFLRSFGRVQGPAPWEVALMNADGSGQQGLARNAASLSAPVWAPNGRTIAYVSRHNANNEISVVKADGSGERNLTRDPGGDRDPAWSPDGRKIVFVRNFQIYVMDANGSGQTRLTYAAARHLAPAWSPDGRQIAFDRRLGRRQYGPCSGCGRASRFEVWVMNADGSGQRRLSQSGAQPLWSSDGRRIAFVSERDGNAEIYVMNADGSSQRNVSRTPNWNEYSFAWSSAPNG
jgi:Tol biopolymer transport system component